MIAGCGFKIRARLKLTSRFFIPTPMRPTLSRFVVHLRRRGRRICCEMRGEVGTTDF